MQTAVSQIAIPLQQPRVTRPLHLTPRELEVLALLSEGLPNKLIGRRLNISAATVKCHISRILDELGVTSRLQAVLAAARRGLLTESSSTPAAVELPSPIPSSRDMVSGSKTRSRALMATII